MILFIQIMLISFLSSQLALKLFPLKMFEKNKNLQFYYTIVSSFIWAMLLISI
jgi:hypothetical protein